MDPELELCLHTCPVCQEPRSLRETIFHHCGHFVCSACWFDERNGKSKATPDSSGVQQPKCWTCNLEIAYPPHRIYIDIEDLVLKPKDPPPKKIDLLDKLDAIDENTPAISVEKASGKIRKLLEREGNDVDTQKAIEAALKRLDEHTAPTYQKLAQVEAQNAELQEENRLLKIAQISSKAFFKQVEQELLATKEELERQTKRAERYRLERNSAQASLSETKKNMAEAVDVRDKQIRLQHSKLKALTKSQKRKSSSSVNLDTSLVVESPQAIDLDADTTRRIKRKKDVLENVEQNIRL